MRFVLLLLVFLVPHLGFAQPQPACRALSGIDATALLNHAAAAIGLAGADGHALYYVADDVINQNYQSDRQYPPYLMGMMDHELWFDPATGIERTHMTMKYPASGRVSEMTAMRNSTQNVILRGDQAMPAPESFGSDRMLNPWAAVLDFQNSTVKSVSECEYRGYPRWALERVGLHGPEWLFLDTKTHVPVKVHREEAHYLWGQVEVEYLYATWQQFGEAILPASTNRVVDGEAEIMRTIIAAEVKPLDEDVPMEIDANIPPISTDPPYFLRAIPPDTVQVNDDVYLLTNPGYTEAVAVYNDTLYVFDATQGEARAQLDHALAQSTFGIDAETSIVLVVTDLAWPHIAGVRYWVAQGATVVSHTESEAFLRRVMEQEWTREPDLLEQRRAQVAFDFVGINARTAFAGGRVILYPIDGVSSEGALNAYLPTADFLWAGDYIQSVQSPTLYAAEVYRAAQREGFAPQRTAAQHMPLTPWATIEALVGSEQP
ncbi:MAG: hypothetical protein RhofKO_37130 [Rhodothermales bacterium]